MSDFKETNKTPTPCEFCDRIIYGLGNIKRHAVACYLNPINLRLCEVCEKPVRNFKTAVTCSYSCSNTKYRSGENNPNFGSNHYRAICFRYHEKRCIICGEENVVAVHHYDYDHENDDPRNLIPICPTHHHYLHSEYKYKIVKEVDAYYTKMYNEIAFGD